jgi:hypothetical protein
MMMTAALDQPTAKRLAKLLGMCGSAHDGERAAAAAKADRLVRKLGLTWHDVIVAPALVPTENLDRPPWRELAGFCHARQAQLRPREREFIMSMLQWDSEPSEKQHKWLRDIHARLSGSEMRR